jgi:hypothetical protein
MNLSKIGSATAVAAVALALTLAGCGSDSSSDGSASSTTSSAAATSSSQTTSGSLEPRDLENAAGTNYTIADYIKDNNITETPIKMGDPDAPAIDLPIPEGWSPAGDDTPDYAYAAIVYTGDDASGSDYTPNFVALLSRLEGNVDGAALIEAAGGELKNLPSSEIVDEREATLSSFPAYEIAATYDLEGTAALSAQKTVVITTADGATYILQLNGTSDQAQAEILGDAANTIDTATIEP